MDDETLVRRCLEGDTEAFSELVMRYERPLFNVALRTLRNHEEARDATQCAFVKAWTHLGQFDRSRRFFSWIYRIVLNESLNRATRHKQVEPLDERIVDPGASPAGLAEDRELRVQIEQAMGQLSGRDREVVVLRHWLQLSYEEIAEVLQIPPKTVKSRLFSARTRLGVILHSMGVETP